MNAIKFIIGSCILLLMVAFLIIYSIKNKEFLAFTLTPAFWKSFFLGFFVGMLIAYIVISINVGLVPFFMFFLFSIFFFMVFSVFLSIFFSTLKTIFHSRTIVILDKKKKHQRINFIFMCSIAIIFACSDIFFISTLYILYNI